MVTWANDVLVEAPRLQELGPAWKPLCPTNWSCERNKFGATVKPVHPRGGDGGARGGMHDVAAAARFREGLVTGAVSLWGVLGEGCHWTDLSKSFPMVVQTLRKGQMVMRNEGVKVGHLP